jgi:hypothetical protein
MFVDQPLGHCSQLEVVEQMLDLISIHYFEVYRNSMVIDKTLLIELADLLHFVFC